MQKKPHEATKNDCPFGNTLTLTSLPPLPLVSIPIFYQKEHNYLSED